MIDGRDRPRRDPLHDLRAVMARLRAPEGGCPWDRAQDFASIAPYTLEEAYEVVDCIERRAWPELKAELGDLLFQVVYHARMAEEAGLFDFDDVARGVADKMVRRHPHVFADATIANAEAQSAAWEAIKAAERAAKEGAEGALDGVPRALPALVRAQKIQARAAQLGFDWPEVAPVLAKVEEELAELCAAQEAGDEAGLREEMGDLLFACVNLARHLECDAEAALRQATAKFQRRFARVEEMARNDGQKLEEMSLEMLEVLWQNAKNGL
ncbi:MAG: nucleoside triphosphate pyrophosphohydrolase [Pseudomonadota bacterium]